jgi:uncharacterized protein (DUF427 family)
MLRPKPARNRYEAPYDAVAAIKDHVALYPDRIDAIEEHPAAIDSSGDAAIE